MISVISLIILMFFYFPIMIVKYNNPEAAEKIGFKFLTLVVNLTLTTIYTIRIAIGEGYLLIYILVGLFLIISSYTFFEILEDLKEKRQ